jgi:hypothetical protein
MKDPTTVRETTLVRRFTTIREITLIRKITRTDRWQIPINVHAIVVD